MTSETQDIESLAKQVESHPDYRVLRRLKPRTEFAVQAKGAIARGVVVDTETTGTDPSADEIIEIGMVVFEFDTATGYALRVVDTYDALEQPSHPIPPEVTQIHGITDAMVAGMRINDQRVASMLGNVTLVVAHNAAFDRQFLERRLPIFAKVAWGCSFKEIPWSLEGYGSAKLDYILNVMGYFHEAHRAEADCLALLEVLQMPLQTTGMSAFAALTKSANVAGYRIWARNSPFDNKDRLKARGYRWAAPEKCWYLDSTEATLAADLSLLKIEGYNSKPAKVELEKLDATIRYSKRGGEREVRLI
jgi:DNA polymerase-3 subunit epsilon